jgi:hypothetical protein
LSGIVFEINTVQIHFEKAPAIHRVTREYCARALNLRPIKIPTSGEWFWRAFLFHTAAMRQNDAQDDFDEHAIRKIAYALWESRGTPIGSPDVDWIEAERQWREGELDSRADP